MVGRSSTFSREEGRNTLLKQLLRVSKPQIRLFRPNFPQPLRLLGWGAEPRTPGGLSRSCLFSAALRKPLIGLIRRSTGLGGWFVAGKMGKVFIGVHFWFSTSWKSPLVLKTLIQLIQPPATEPGCIFPTSIFLVLGMLLPARNPDRRKNTFGRDKLQRIEASSPKPRSLSSWIVYTHSWPLEPFPFPAH